MKVKIYRIVNDINDEIYIGSTRNVLATRFQQHRRDSKKERTSNIWLYKLALEIGWDAFRIVLMEELEVANKQEQLREEQRHIDLLKPSLNRIAAIGQKCPHGKIRCRCKECSGTSICQHSKAKNLCKKCDGNLLCEHKLQKNYCKDCKGSAFCEHDKRRSLCKECSMEYCEDCGKSLSKATIKNHLKTNKHIMNALPSYASIFL